MFNRNSKETKVPMPEVAQGYLNKKVQSKLCSMFKKTVSRWFYFKLKTGEFGYKKYEKRPFLKKMHYKKDLLNYSPSVEKDDPLATVFNYGFKVFTSDRVYVLYTNDETSYSNWMRMFNFYFHYFDIINDNLRKQIPLKPFISQGKKRESVVSEPQKKNKISLLKSKVAIEKEEEDSQSEKSKDASYSQFGPSENNTLNQMMVENLHLKENKEKIVNKYKDGLLSKIEGNIEATDKNNSNNVRLNEGFRKDIEVKQENMDLNKIKVNIARKMLKKEREKMLEGFELATFSPNIEKSLDKSDKISNDQRENILNDSKIQPVREELIPAEYDEQGRIIMQIYNNFEYLPHKDKNKPHETEKLKFLDVKSVLVITKSFLKQEDIKLETLEDKEISEEKEDQPKDHLQCTPNESKEQVEYSEIQLNLNESETYTQEVQGDEKEKEKEKLDLAEIGKTLASKSFLDEDFCEWEDV